MNYLDPVGFTPVTGYVNVMFDMNYVTGNAEQSLEPCPGFLHIPDSYETTKSYKYVVAAIDRGELVPASSLERYSCTLTQEEAERQREEYRDPFNE